jgi:hypothetical protein
MRRVCIQENARVQASDFVSVVREGFERHGIVTAVFSGTIVALSPILNSIKFWGFKWGQVKPFSGAMPKISKRTFYGQVFKNRKSST